jgi:transglutaminase-like putative cysteine protease
MIRASHLLVLAVLTAWLAWAHPAGAAMALAVLVAAVAAELLPSGALRDLVAPLVILVGGCLGAALGGFSAASLHAGLGTLLVALMTVPARPGGLRLIAPLCGLELVACSLPGSATPLWLAAAVLVPVALASLALDAWHLAPRHSGRAAWWRWALLPAAAAAVCGLAALPAAQGLKSRPVRTATAAAAAHTATPTARPAPLRFNLDHQGSIPREPQQVARLMLPAPPQGLTYLRVTAAGLVVRPLGGGPYTWQPLHGDRDEPEGETPAVTADLVRLPGFGDAVFVPDDGDWCNLDGIVRDGDGNRWRTGLAEAVRSYQVAITGAQRRDDDADARDLYTALPPELAGPAWARVEDPAWRDLPTLIAAERITARLRGRCEYALDKLPISSDPLATFLFADDATQRRGHCQFFAEACAVLLRRAGHPARVVAGFASSEWDGTGVVFRRLHAHAWIEVLAEGLWHRVDPTPPVAHDLAARIAAQADPTPPVQPHQAVPLPQPTTTSTRWWWWLGLLLPAAGLGWWLRRHRHEARATPAERRAAELASLARELGLTVRASDTAAAICQRLHERTGIDLSAELAAYHAARFAGGPSPPPWPAERLRAAATPQRRR